MARPESVALAGYYPTPASLVSQIAGLIDAGPAYIPIRQTKHGTGTYDTYANISIFDPCAGDGAALGALALTLFPRKLASGMGPRVDLYACELELERARQCRQLLPSGSTVRCADAFTLTWNTQRDDTGANLLWLNPPYDTDPLAGRLEHAFLERFTRALMPGIGILVFIVPHYALTASAEYLAERYTDLHCYRFPAGEFEQFKQVVLIARRRLTRLSPTLVGDVVQRVLGWAADATSCPVLEAQLPPVVALHPNESAGLGDLRAGMLDVRGISKALRPWCVGVSDTTGLSRTARGGLAPLIESGLQNGLPDYLSTTSQIAMPAKPAYLALLLASGMLNGCRVEPNKAAPGWPALLVKGRFRKDFMTVSQKMNKDGEITGEVQVQQPTLTVTVLTMDDKPHYITLDQGTTPTDATSIDTANIADLLEHYGEGLADTMMRQFPPMHDPADPAGLLPLPELGRALYTSQYHVVQTETKLLGRGLNPYLLGEVGTGKSFMSLAITAMFSRSNFETTATALKRLELWDHERAMRPIDRVVIMCPPHLVKSWGDQISMALPGAATVIVRAISDLNSRPTPGVGAGSDLTFYILSRETAKLGHTMGSGVWIARLPKGGTITLCPRCGAPTPLGQQCADKRLRCKAQPTVALGNRRAGALARKLAAILVRVERSEEISGLVPGRIMQMRGLLPGHEDQRWTTAATEQIPGGWSALVELARELGDYLLAEATKSPERSTPYLEHLINAHMLLHLAAPTALRERMIHHTFERMYPVVAEATQHQQVQLREHLLELTLLIADLNMTALERWEREIATKYPIKRRYTGEHTVLETLLISVRKLKAQRELSDAIKAAPTKAEDLRASHGIRLNSGSYNGAWRVAIKSDTGSLQWSISWGRDYIAGAAKTAIAALGELATAAVFLPGRECGEPLFQSTPQPRRYPLARYIFRHARNLANMVILDEVHEFNNVGSAQEQAAHLLAKLGVPSLSLTGSLTGGYASSLFANYRATSAEFRREFSADEKGKFVQRYGYLKVLKTLEPATRSGGVTEYGKASLREERDEDPIIKVLGEAPGVMPIFLPKYLLPTAAIIHKSDLDVEIPPMQETPLALDLLDGGVHDREIAHAYLNLREELIDQIARDSFDKLLAGRLLGPLVESASFPDMATDDVLPHKDAHGTPCHEIRYSKNAGEMAGRLVTRAYGVPASHITLKERWMLDTLREQLGRGRNILVFMRHTGNARLVSRYQKMITRELQTRPVYLDSSRVGTQIREQWIIDNVISTGTRVLLLNPESVKTGLNCLTPHFTTAIWQEMTVNALTYRQANGRIHRIGSDPNTTIEVYVPVYANTAQETLLDLVARKLSVSRQMDGIDIASQLEAAGAGTAEEVQALAQASLMSLGQAMFDILSGKTAARPRAIPLVHLPSAGTATPTPTPAAPQQLSLF